MKGSIKMKRDMKRLFSPLCALVALTMTVAPLQAADSAGPRQAGQKIQAEKGPAFDLNFPGGPLPELVKAIEKAGGQKLNVMLPREAAQVVVPKLTLSGVNSDAVFSALNLVLNQQKRVGQFISNGNIWVFQIIPERPDTRQTKVFFVGHLLSRDKFKIQDITTAIQTAWDLGGEQAVGELKFHQDTQLLFARAVPSQLEAMQEVLVELSKAAVMPERPGK
jgi:hypothetical protein